MSALLLVAALVAVPQPIVVACGIGGAPGRQVVHPDGRNFGEDLYENRTRSHIKERLGDKSDLALVFDIGNLYRVDGRQHLDFVDNDGNWATCRGAQNGADMGRGDESSTLDSEKSVESVGVLQVRKVAWYRRCGSAPAPNVHLFHCSTLLSGAHRAWVEDKDKKRNAVELSIHMGCDDCNEYDTRTPDDAVVFLVHLATQTISNQAWATSVQKWQATKEAEATFTREKQLRT